MRLATLIVVQTVLLKQWFLSQTSFFRDSSFLFNMNWNVYISNEDRLTDFTYRFLVDYFVDEMIVF